MLVSINGLEQGLGRSSDSVFSRTPDVKNCNASEIDEMIVVPREIPVIEELNSYYLDIEKLFTYYQGILEGGCAFLQFTSAQGVLFFNASSLVDGTLKNATSFIRGPKAIDMIIAEASSKNVLISLYKVPLEKIPFWTAVASAEDLYKDLSTEFTNLKGLVRKMKSDRLTGYIEVAFNSGDMEIVFFQNGQVAGLMSTASKWKLVKTDILPPELVEKSQRLGAVLNVRRISLEKTSVDMTGNAATSAYSILGGQPAASPSDAAPAKILPDLERLDIREMLQYLLLIYDTYISSNRKIQGDFKTILKQKFLERVEKYDFLDPFVADFTYMDGKIEYTGLVDDTRLASGLLDCLGEIAAENDMQAWLDKSLWPFREKYADEIEYLNVTI